MNLRKCILTANNCYKSNVEIKPIGVVLHSTGANNPNLRRYVQPLETDPDYAEIIDHIGLNQYGNDWNCAKPDGIEVCVHAFIGRAADGSVATYQTLPWSIRGWHSGYASKSSITNANKLGYIGIEICEDNLVDYMYFNQVYREAVEVVAYLCQLHRWNPQADGVILCHSEGFKRGIASNHVDVTHWFPVHGKSMDTFRRDVAELLETRDSTGIDPVEHVNIYGTLKDVPTVYKPAIQRLMELGVLSGHEDPDPATFEDNVLNVTEDFCRIMTVLNRLGLIK